MRPILLRDGSQGADFAKEMSFEVAEIRVKF
jgi:hypothetical protein